MLEAVGLCADDETVYLSLVEREVESLGELVERTALDLAAVEQAAVRLRGFGLVEASTAGVRAAPPEIALRLLTLKRLDDVRRVEHAIGELTERYRGRPSEANEAIELVEGAREIAERFAMANRAATHEITSLIKAPVLAVTPGANAGQRDAMRAGVTYRAVYDRALVDVDEREVSLLLEDMASLGEQMRISADVPFKLTVFDRELALIVPRDSSPVTPSILMVRSRPLVEALAWIADRIWDAALPMPAVLPESPTGSLTEDDRRLLALLLAGYSDGAIASQLGVSIRTVQRRLHRLLQVAGVQTRIQLGFQAARRGWL